MELTMADMGRPFYLEHHGTPLEKASLKALFKMDVEFHREDGVDHLEGWTEANRLRRGLGLRPEDCPWHPWFKEAGR